MKNLDILIAGGDMRQLYCAERLAAYFSTAVIGFDDEYIPDELAVDRAAAGEKHKYDCAVLPVMPLDENGMLTSPCSRSILPPEVIRDMLREGGTVFAGRADERLRQVFSGFQVREYLDREELVLKNAVPTAEGAVQIALEELPVTLNGLKVLVTGMGRTGSTLAALLKGFGADVTAAVRSEKGAAKARIAGVRAVRMEDMDSSCGLVINTVPALIFDRERLLSFGRDTLFIDIASKPGGVDFKAARELGIKAIWALGIPGKSAPVTSGQMIAETIADMLAEGGAEN